MRPLYATYKKTLSATLLAFFACYFACVNFFPHIHQTGWGSVVHSHPYFGGSENPRHNHSQAQLDLISALSLFQMLLPAAMLVAAIAVAPVARAAERRHDVIFQVPRHSFGLRAPPAVA